MVKWLHLDVWLWLGRVVDLRGWMRVGLGVYVSRPICLHESDRQGQCEDGLVRVHLSNIGDVE